MNDYAVWIGGKRRWIFTPIFSAQKLKILSIGEGKMDQVQLSEQTIMIILAVGKEFLEKQHLV